MIDKEKQQRIKNAEESIKDYFRNTFPDRFTERKVAKLNNKHELEEKRLRLLGLWGNEK